MWRVTPLTSTCNHFWSLGRFEPSKPLDCSFLVDPQVGIVCSTFLLLFFTCTNIIDAGEPDPSSPALILYFLRVPLSGFLFLPPASLSPSAPGSWITVYQCRAGKRLPDRIMFCLILGSCAVMRANSVLQWEQEEAEEGVMRGKNDRFVFLYAFVSMCIYGKPVYLHKQVWLTSFPIAGRYLHVI